MHMVHITNMAQSGYHSEIYAAFSHAEKIKKQEILIWKKNWKPNFF